MNARRNFFGWLFAGVLGFFFGNATGLHKKVYVVIAKKDGFTTRTVYPADALGDMKAATLARIRSNVFRDHGWDVETKAGEECIFEDEVAYRVIAREEEESCPTR